MDSSGTSFSKPPGPRSARSTESNTFLPGEMEIIGLQKRVFAHGMDSHVDVLFKRWIVDREECPLALWMQYIQNCFLCDSRTTNSQRSRQSAQSLILISPLEFVCFLKPILRVSLTALLKPLLSLKRAQLTYLTQSPSAFLHYLRRWSPLLMEDFPIRTVLLEGFFWKIHCRNGTTKLLLTVPRPKL